MDSPDQDGGSKPVASVHSRATTSAALPRTIELRAPAVVRHYVARIAQHLEASGHRVRTIASSSARTPATIDWLLYFERLAYRSDGAAFQPVPDPSPPLSREDPCDLVIDLAGDAPESNTPTLRLIFETGAGEPGLLAALLAAQAVKLAITSTEAEGAPRVLRHACLAVERPASLGSALDGVTPRLATLLAQAVADLGRDAPSGPAASGSPVPPSAPALVFATNALARRIADRLSALLRRPDCWRIAIRLVGDQGVMERLDWSGPQWRIMPDDGKRFFADPFLFAWEGRQWLFCEEFPYATGKGILSVAPIDGNGDVGAARPILETAGHLSWPQVFAHQSHIYMIPESAAAGRIELWRATNFPEKWTLDRVLVDHVHAHDPVLHMTEQGALMLANVNDDGGSSWDALGLFHAPDLFGDWRAHDGNPLLVDASSVRGASPIIHQRGELWRATQDCRTGYGDGLVLCRVTRLDAGGFAQEVVVRLGAPPNLGATGSHSLSRSGPLEAIDIRGSQRTPAPRLTRTP